MKALAELPEANPNDGLADWERILLDEHENPKVVVDPYGFEALAELADPKDGPRALFQRQAVTQDHGTRGNSRHYDIGDDVHFSYITPGESRKKRALAQEKLIDADAQAELLESMSPGQLEKAANSILKASGFEIDEAYAEHTAREMQALEELDAKQVEALEYNGDDLNVVKADEPDEAYLQGQAELRAEIQGALKRGKAVLADPAYHYEGTVDDSQLADYMFGMHFTDRP